MIVVESALLLHLLAEPGYAKCQAPSALVRPYVARAVRERDAAPWRFSRDHCAEFHVWWHALFSAPRATRSKRAKQPASREGTTTRGGWTPKRRSRRRSRQQALERQAEKPHRLEEEKKRASKKLAHGRNQQPLAHARNQQVLLSLAHARNQQVLLSLAPFLYFLCFLCVRRYKP